MSELFAGYREVAAFGDDQYIKKWLAVSSSLDVPLDAVALTVPALTKVNTYINREVVYKHEPDGADDWQIPVLTWSMRVGDCEDFAILKYALLRKSGLPEKFMRVVVGEIKAMPLNRGHAFLAAQIEGSWHVLDNMFDQLISPNEYINWHPVAAVWSNKHSIFGPVFTLNEQRRV